MKARKIILSTLCIIGLSSVSLSFAHSSSKKSASHATSVPATTNTSNNTSTTLLPAAPQIDAKAYVLMDANSGKIIAEKNMQAQRQPASLTKLMTIYITFRAIQHHTINLNDEVPISANAWKMTGSKMFVKVGSHATVEELIQGVIVDSGNDAAIALAEYIGGTESSFVNMMNQQAQALGMKNTHFADSNGLPNPNNLTTAQDLGILSDKIILQFPQMYQQYFSQKWFTYNGIKQPNRNRLLWRYPGADGLKTGFTNAAGYCMIASAQQDGMRLISVVLGTPSDQARNDDSIAMLRYGFRYFTTKELYAPAATVTQMRVWYGKDKMVNLGVMKGLYVTVQKDQINNLQSNFIVPPVQLNAPIQKGQVLGTIKVSVNGKTIAAKKLKVLQDNPKGGLWRRLYDSIAHYFANRHSKKASSKS